MLNLKCTIYLQSQNCIDFTKDYAQEDIPSGGQVLLEVTMYVKIYGGKCEFFLKFNDIVYVQAETTRLRDHVLVVINIYPWFFMSNTILFVAYVDDFSFGGVHNIRLIKY